MVKLGKVRKWEHPYCGFGEVQAFSLVGECEEMFHSYHRDLISWDTLSPASEPMVSYIEENGKE